MKKLIRQVAIVAIGAFAIYFFKSKKNKFLNKEKVIFHDYNRPVSGLDPILVEDNTSLHEASKVYEGLLEYHYLKKPVEIIPNLADSLPEISEDGTRYTFKIKKGVFFQDNKCFPNGKGRELKSTDFIYSIKRFADPKNSAPLYSTIDGKILGLNEWREKNKDLESTDYSIAVAGLEYIDDYTFSIKLNEADPLFIYNFCMWIFYVVPKEAVDYYGDNFTNHPVGTGPFIIEGFNPQSNKIVAVKNKNYRDKRYPSEASEHLKHLLGPAGKKIPFVDKIIANIIIEDQTRWFKFKKKEIDILDLYSFSDIKEKVKDGEIIDSSLIKMNVGLALRPFSHTDFYGINCCDDVMKNVKLRQAMSLAYDREGGNTLLNGGVHTVAKGMIPPTMKSYDPSSLSKYSTYNLEEARALLSEAGYPEGKGLGKITLDIKQGAQDYREAEYFKKCMEKIGIDIEIRVSSWPELLNKVKNKSCQLFKFQWFADYPNAENFLVLFVSTRPGVYTYYSNSEYDKLYDKATKISLDREEEIENIYKEMNKILVNDAPVFTKIHAHQVVLFHENILNFEPWDVKLNIYEYIDKK